MNSAINNSNPSAHLDALARQSHAASLGAVSPQTLARLRAARHAAQADTQATASGGRWRWIAATAFSGLLAVVAGVQFFERPAVPDTAAALATTTEPTALSEYRDSAELLDENPDLYLWLASIDAQPIAME